MINQSIDIPSLQNLLIIDSRLRLDSIIFASFESYLNNSLHSSSTNV